MVDKKTQWPRRRYDVFSMLDGTMEALAREVTSIKLTKPAVLLRLGQCPPNRDYGTFNATKPTQNDAHRVWWVTYERLEPSGPVKVR